MLSRAGKVRIKTPIDTLVSSGVLIKGTDTLNVHAPKDLFDNNHPIEVEIGCGKGGLLIQRALSQPNVNLLGIEWLPSYAAFCADRAYRHGLANIRVINADAKEIFTNLPASPTFRRVYILFPDPWPKRKHWKRRLINQDFVEKLISTMEVGGIIYIATDHLHYYQQICRNFSINHHIALVTGKHQFLHEELIPHSNYARKWLSEGKQIYTFEAMKI